jgi:hypothetical protein
MLLPLVSSTDATALGELRSGAPRPMPRPRELTRTLWADYGTPVGYAFSWGQLLERTSPLPDPDTERYTGVSWTIVPALAWRNLLPRLQACGWHLYHVLRRARGDGTECINVSVPASVYVQCLTCAELATLTTLCEADAQAARAWIADQFVPHDLPLVLEAYQEHLGELVYYRRELGLAEAAENGGAI